MLAIMWISCLSLFLYSALEFALAALTIVYAYSAVIAAEGYSDAVSMLRSFKDALDVVTGLKLPLKALPAWHNITTTLEQTVNNLDF